MKSLFKQFVFLATCFLVAACGGSSSSERPQANAAPVASIEVPPQIPQGTSSLEVSDGSDGTLPAQATQISNLRFRYSLATGECVDENGVRGTNPGYVGDCGYLANVISIEGNFAGMSLRGAYLQRANLTRARASGADLRHAYFQYAVLTEVQLDHADLRHAYFQYANLSRSVLSQSDLRHAYLQYADLSGGDWNHSDLSHAYLQDANLNGCNLNHSDLHHANLRNVNLRDANLQDAHLEYADLTGATFTDQTLLPFSQEEAVRRGMVRMVTEVPRTL